MTATVAGNLGPAGPSESVIHSARGYAHTFQNPAPGTEPGDGIGGKNVQMLDSSENWMFRQNDTGVFIRRMLGGYEVGEIKWFPTEKDRDGLLRCDGAAVSRATYAELFDEIGTSYGIGDGSTTFNLPNDVDAVVIGGGGALAFTNGITGANTANVQHSHTTPSHDHSITHTHSGPSHTHGMDHAHDMSSHEHAGPSHTHGMTHTHSHDHGNLTGASNDNETRSIQENGTSRTWANETHGHSIPSDNTGSSAASTGSGGTGDTGPPSVSDTGGASDTTTDAGGTGSTGAASNGTSGGSSPTTNTSLSTTQSLVQRSWRAFAYIYSGQFSGA
jgi:microcystin-dependent protein